MAFFDVPRDEDITLRRAGGWTSPLDGFCANPAVLPLPERERVFVKYVLRIATNPGELQPKDFRAVMNTIFTTVATTALRED